MSIRQMHVERGSLRGMMAEMAHRADRPPAQQHNAIDLRFPAERSHSQRTPQITDGTCAHSLASCPARSTCGGPIQLRGGNREVGA